MMERFRGQKRSTRNVFAELWLFSWRWYLRVQKSSDASELTQWQKCKMSWLGLMVVRVHSWLKAHSSSVRPVQTLRQKRRRMSSGNSLAYNTLHCETEHALNSMCTLLIREQACWLRCRMVCWSIDKSAALMRRCAKPSMRK